MLLARYYEGDQIEEVEICRACGRMRWQNDIKTDRKEILWEGMKWIDVIQEQVADCC